MPPAPSADIFPPDEPPTRPDSPAARRKLGLARCADAFQPITRRHRREAVMREVTAARTVVSRYRMADAMADAWGAITGAGPDPKSLAIVLAHWAHETATGAQMYNFNVGNWKCVQPATQEHCYFATTEVLAQVTADHAVAASTPAAPCRIVKNEGPGLVRVLFEPRHPVCRFKSFPTLEIGCEAYVTGMRGGWPNAWAEAERANATGFAHALKLARYYSDSEAKYMAAMTAHYRLFLPITAPLPDPQVATAWSLSESQHVLGKLGFYEGLVDGAYGPLTKAGAQAFQTSAGLPATGVMDDATRVALGEALRKLAGVSPGGVT